MKREKTIEITCCDICGKEITNDFIPKLKFEKDLCIKCNDRLYEETKKLFNDRTLLNEAFEQVRKRFPLEKLKQ